MIETSAGRERHWGALVQLIDLVAGIPGARIVRGDPTLLVQSITHDSRQAGPGALFVAVPGFERHGQEFISDAINRGAVAVAGENVPALGGAVAEIEIPVARRALADLAAAFYGHPSRRLTLVGVTGTDGKTTTTRLISAILAAAGRRTGWLTTVDLGMDEQVVANPFARTTPEAPDVQRLLAQMANACLTDAVLEVSSHALALDRVRGCEFDAAVFTNLSPEHLNFHGTMDAYLAAKARLFAMVGRNATKHRSTFAVVNADDPAAGSIAAACSAPVLPYGFHGPAAAWAEDIVVTARGTEFTLCLDHDRLADVRGGQRPREERFRLRTSLIGTFNVSNWLAASTTALALGADMEAIERASATVRPVRGRMEFIDCGQPFAVVVDFCHTPQAFTNALDTLRPLTRGRLMVAFGLAGGRDTGNRPRMGEIATKRSDLFVITTDDPESEDPAEICDQISKGAKAAGAREGEDYVIELDRMAAVRLLMGRAQPGDTVLLAGKGHERRQIVGGARLPWSDEGAARESLAELGYNDP